jgi:hypothetical protein
VDEHLPSEAYYDPSTFSSADSGKGTLSSSTFKFLVWAVGAVGAGVGLLWALHAWLG